MTLNIFFIGDIVGTPGLDLAATLIPNYVKKYGVDLLIVNGENTTEGKGIAEEHAKRLFELGAHVITTGNHVWDRWDSRKVLGSDRRILRPLNYPRENGGNGYYVADIPGKGKAGILNLQGRVFMQPIDDPFRTADWAVAKIHEETPVVFVDQGLSPDCALIGLTCVETHRHFPPCHANTSVKRSMPPTSCPSALILDWARPVTTAVSP